MKTTKILISLCLAIFYTMTNMQAQVAIGTTNTPVSGSALDLGQVSAQNLGLMTPKVNLSTITAEDKISLQKEGMVIFNVADSIFMVFQHNAWSSLPLFRNGDSGYIIQPRSLAKTDSLSGDAGIWIYGQTSVKSSTAGTSPYFATVQRKGAQSDPKYLTNDNNIFRLHGYIQDPKGTRIVNAIEFRADGDHSNISSPTKILFYTTSPNTLGTGQPLPPKMILNSAGNLGIGIVSPTEKLHVVGNSLITGNNYISGNMGIGTTSPIQGLHLAKGKAMLAGDAPASGFYHNGTASTDGILLENSGTNSYSMWMQRSSTGASLYLSKNKTLAGAIGSSHVFLACYLGTTGGSGSQIGSITSNASGTGLVYNATSDKRLKENITNTHYSLSDLMKISVKDYNFKSDETKTVQTGFLAQDLYEVYPEAVSVGGENAQENPWAVDYGKVTPLLVKAIQDQQKIIEQLEARIKVLESK